MYVTYTIGNGNLVRRAADNKMRSSTSVFANSYISVLSE